MKLFILERLKKAIKAVKGLFRSVMASPKLTVRAAVALPSTVRGMQFGREATFTNGAQLADKNPVPPNEMAAYFESHQEGPGIWKWRHYFDIYQRHFNRFVGREVHVLEIGIYSGGSLLMWKEYFGENAKIYGVDIHESGRGFEDERTKVFIGDQAPNSLPLGA